MSSINRSLFGPGIKLYRWIDDELEVLRVVYVTDDCIKVKKQSDGTTMKLTEKDIHDNYTILNPDGVIGISIVNLKDDLEDVMVTLYRRKEIEEKSPLPYCVCRQNITDFFANSIAENMNYCGVCVSTETLPEGVAMESILVCDGVSKSTSVFVYMDDTLEDILRFVKTKDYDIVLHNLFTEHLKYKSSKMNELIGKAFFDSSIKSTSVDGYCKTLKDLLVYNNFMYDFLRGFDIYPLNVDIENAITDPIENEKFNHIISDLLCKNVVKSMAVKYDKDIDLSAIERDYILVSDKNDKLYVVAYISQGKYHIPVENIETAENIASMVKTINPSPTSSLTEAYNMIRFSKDKYK